MLRIVIWHIFSIWSQSENLSEIKPPLKNTVCMPTYQDASVKTCRCKKGHLPLPRLKETALVPGCEETELAKLLTVDSCKRQFTLGAITGTPAQVGFIHKLR